ncbi:hypothetical protein K2173_013927 [Erythroxylum novogranatense]|uniref:Titin-like n=1 Tax=Erythroxylum novogranatense TaxID=1862640 RepID=A0AAV8SCT6_9ROSI|nr:hypothetical protein K2173_013927 [Erythroxylum novogranatense]
MATEANISEPVYIKEKEEVNVNFNPHDINHPPETGDHLMKSEKVQELGQDGVEAKQLDLKANMEVLEGEFFLKSPSFAMVDSQETCQDLDLSPQTAKERPESGEENEKHEVSEVEEEMLTDKIETLTEREETAERNERDFEIVDDKGTGYQEDESAKVLSGAEEDKTSKEEKALEENGGDINSLASAEEKQENIQKQISSLQISEEVEKKIDENTESAADEELSRHEAKLGEFKEAPIRTPDPTVDNLETGAETFKVSISEQESGDTSARSEPKVSEEIIGRKVVDGLVEKETCCLEEKDPVAIIPIGKTENDKEGLAFSTVGETSSIEEATPGVDIDKEASSEIREGMMCELDIASISPATDFSSTQQTVSKVEDKLGQLSGITSNEEEENKVESSRHIKDVNVAVDQRQEKQKIETPIVTQGDHMYPQKEDNSDIVNIVSVESDSHDDFKNDPPESEILGETVLADSVSGHIVISAEDIRTSVEHNKEETSKLEENWEEFSKEQYELEKEMVESSSLGPLLNLPPRELDEEIKVLIQDKKVNDLKKPNSLEPEAELVEDSKLEEACDIHSQNQVQKVKKVSKVVEKHIQNESEAHKNKLEPEGTGKIPQTENMHDVAESDSEVKLGSKDSVMNVEDKTQEIEKSSEHIERSNTEEVSPIEVISTDAEISQAESLQQAAASTLRGEVEETIKTTGVKSDEVHNGPKMIGSREATDEQNTITDDGVIESLRNTGRKAEILDEQDIVSQRMGDDTIKGSSQEYAEKGPSKNFEITDVDTEKLSRKDYEGSETDGSIVNEIDRSANLTFQFSVVNDQESLKGERSTGEEVAQEKREIKVNDNESNSEPPEVQEEIKEALKHEEEVEEKLQNYEPGESIERSNKALFPDSEADKCGETAYKPKGEKVDGPEESAEAEMPNVKDTDAQLADMSNIKYLSQEPDKEEMVNNFQTSETNAQISNKENVDESENAGTGQSSASETNHNDESLNSTLATSLVEETEIVQDKSKNMARSEASSGKKKEEYVSTVQAVEGNVTSIRLEEANQNSKETAKCEENNEPEEVENSAILMAVDNEASASNEKATDDTEEIQNDEENTVEGGKEGFKDTDGTEVESVAMKEANQNNEETAEYEAEVKLGKNEVEEIESTGVPLTIENEAMISSEMTIDENEDIQNVENTMQEKKEEGIKDETEAERVAVKEKANRNSEETIECEAQVELAKNEVEEIGNTGIPSVIINEAPISNEKTIDETEYIQNVKEEEEANQKREEATESEGHVELEKNEVEDFKNSGISSAIENGAPLSNEKTTDETEDIQNVEEKKEVGMKVTDETEVERVAVKEDANQNSEETTNYGEQDLQKNEPEEIEISASQVLGNEAPISNEKETHDPLCILNIEEKKDEGAKDTNEIKVERVAVKEVAQVVEETSNDRSTVDEKPITSETEVEKLENAYGADSTEKVEEETKDEETKEKHGSEKSADFIKDSETQTLMEEHTGTNISRLSTEDIALSCRPDEAEGKSKEEILEEPDKIRAAKDPENEANKLNERIIEQSREIVTEDDVKLMMPKQEIIHESEKLEISQEKHGENPLQKEKEFENDVMELKEEVKELNSEATASVEATVSELLTDKERSSGLHSAEASEDLTMSKETSESHISVSIPKSDSKELSGKVQPEAHECSCESVRDLTEERSPTGPELPTSDMKEPIMTDTKETTLMGGDIDVKPENFSDLVEKNDSPILVVTNETEEESRHEVSNDATLAGRETEEELVTAETPPCSTLDAKESEKSEAIERIDENLEIDQNAYDNAVNPLVPQSTASTRDEDKTVNAQEVATLGSLDTGIERTTEKVQYYQSENVQEHHDLQTEVHTLKQEETELTYVEETRDLVIEGESGKSKKLDYMESSLPVASLESIEPTSAGRKITILEEENPLNISEVTLQEGAAPEKGDREIEKGNQKQEVEAADHIKCHGQTEENLGSVESSEKLESVGERDKSDQSNISTYKVKPNTIEEINSENQSQCLDSIEKRFQESQTEEMAEPELEAEVSSIKLQNTDETTKAVISVEQVKEDVEETDGDETLKHTLVESNNKKELQSESAVDDTIDEVKESSRAFTEDPVAKDSTEQTEITNLNSRVQPPLKQEKSAIKGEEEENAENEVSKKPIGSVTVVAEEPEELIKEKIVDEGNRCSKEINVADAAEVKPASGSEVAQIDDKIVHISNITSDEIKADTFDSERSQQNIIDTRILENSSSHLASQISADDPENLTNDNAVPKHADGSKHLFDTVNELKGTDKKGPLTGDIEEEIKELSETVPTCQDIEEIATKEVLADENLQEQISYHHIASSPLPSQEEGPGTEATVENVEERTIQVVKMTDEDPDEMHEEAAQTSDEIGEKKEACESTSKSSEDIEIVKHDLTASPEAMHVKKSEERYQTASAALLPEDMEYKRSETTASSGEENNVKVLESKPRSSENPRIFEEPNEDDTPQLDVQLGKDKLEENAIESQQEGSRDPDSHKIEEINEQASELAADSDSKYFEIVADDIVTSSQTPAVENFEEKNEAPHSVLHLKDTDHGTLVATEKIEEVEVLKDGLATAEDPSLQKEELREAEVLPMELPFQKDIQRELIEECEEQGREANEVYRFEEIKEDKNILPTQKSEELSQTQTDSLLPKEQDTTTDAVQNTKEKQVKIATREVTEEPCLQKEKTEDLQVSGLEVQHKNVDKKENMYQPQEDEIRTAEMVELCPKDLESKTKDSDCTTEIEKIPEMTGPIEETSEHMKKATNEDLQYMSEAPSHEPADQSEETVSRERHQEEALADATEIINDEAKEEAIADATEIIHDKAKEEALADATEITHDEAKEQVLTDATEVIHDEAIEKEILEKKEPASASPSVILGEVIAEGSNQEHRVNAEEKQMQSGEINKEIQEGDTSKKSEEQIGSDHSSCQKFHREEINEQASELAAESNSKYFEIVADVVTSSQTAAVENFEEKNEAPPSVLHLKDTDHGLVATKKIEDVEVLKDGLATAEDPFQQKEELGEAELLTMELPLKKDIQKELIEEHEEQGREANEVHRFEEIKEDNIVIPTQKSEELRQTKTASLLPKEQDTSTEAVQNTEEQQVKIATRDVTEEPCLQKEKTEDLQVSRLEFQHKKDEDSEHMYQAQEYEIRTAQMLELCPKDLESKTKDSQCTTGIEQIPEMTGTMEATSEHRTKATNEVLQSVSEAPSHEPADQSEETASRDKHQEKVLADATEIINDEAKEEALAIATGIIHDGAKEEVLADSTEIIHDEAKEEAVADATEIIHDEAKKEVLADATEIVHTEAKEEALADTTEITHDEAKELADATEIIHDEAIEKEILVKKETVSTSPSVILGEAIAEGSNQEHRVNTEEKQMQSGEINKEIQEGDTSKKSEEQISSEHSSCQKFHHKVVQEMCKTEPVLLVSEVERGIEIAQNEGSLDLAKANETIPDIDHGKKISDATSQEQFSTGKVGAPQVQQGLIVETIQNVEGGNLQPENVRMVDAVIKGPEEGKMDDKTEKSIAETVAEDSGKVSLFDIMARSKREGQISENLTTGNEEVKAETEKPKSEDEEEEGGEQEKADSGPAAPVMVEATKGMEVKVEHKKSHSILAGVGSKVKHSISKVKKAIIGKSSHPKQHSPTKTK